MNNSKFEIEVTKIVLKNIERKWQRRRTHETKNSASGDSP